ncbi:MAG: hypothetical protein IPN42_16960 [Methylococcaceae bacterium]|nr:hypothetical protein [Methylococcaceae bacterium]
MSEFTLSEGLFLYPTPAGTFYAVSSDHTDVHRDFILKLLLQPTLPALNLENLSRLTGFEDPQDCYEILYHCQKLNWVQGLDTAKDYPSGPLETLLPGLLAKMSDLGQVLLADMDGFNLASHGFAEDLVDELAVVSAELEVLHKRRSRVLGMSLGITSRSWGIIDVFGNSQIGFWPLFLGKNHFVLVISGVPHFNQTEFVELAWALSVRYADN